MKHKLLHGKGSHKHKDNLQNGRKDLQIRQLTTDSFPIHTNGSHKSITTTTKKKHNQKLGRRPK